MNDGESGAGRADVDVWYWWMIPLCSIFSQHLVFPVQSSSWWAAVCCCRLCWDCFFSGMSRRTLLLTVFWCWYNSNISVNMTCTSVIRAVVASSQTASLISVSPALPHSSLTNSALPAPSPVKTVWEHDTSCYIKAWESNPRWWGVISWCVPLSRGR